LGILSRTLHGRSSLSIAAAGGFPPDFSPAGQNDHLPRRCFSTLATVCRWPPLSALTYVKTIDKKTAAGGAGAVLNAHRRLG